MKQPSVVGLALAAAMSLVVAAQQVPVFRAGVDLVNMGVTVADKKGNLITDLTAADFEIDEDGKKQTLRYFAGGDAANAGPPMHLGLLVDVSESMGEDMSFTKTAAVKFLNTLTDAVDVTVVDFDTDVRTARFSQADFARLIERIRQRKASGNTALYDAIGVYLDGAGGQDGRKVMLLYTDGGDTRSSISFGDLIDLLKASDVTVYPIGELEHQPSSSRGQQRMLLEQMASVTGGQAFFPTAVKELDAVYEKVVAQIRAQYTIGYLSTNEKADGKWRKVDVKVTRKDLRVRSRKGYFAPFQEIGVRLELGERTFDQPAAVDRAQLIDEQVRLALETPGALHPDAQRLRTSPRSRFDIAFYRIELRVELHAFSADLPRDMGQTLRAGPGTRVAVHPLDGAANVLRAR